MNIFKLFEAANDDGAAAGGGGGDRTEVERQATEMGWSPKEKWRGNPDNWIDAPEFVQRGEQVMPILQANLRKEQAKTAALESRLQQQSVQLAAAQESIDVLTNLTTEESRTKAKERRRELLRQQAAARKDENEELEVELGEEIADLTAEIKAGEAEGGGEGKPAKASKKPAASGQPNNGGRDPLTDPTFLAWKGDNPWFGTDNRRTALAVEIGREMRQAGDTTQGRAFFDKVTDEVNKVFAPPQQQQRPSKAEGGGQGPGSNGGGGGGGGGSRSRSYNELPAEAKAACERQSAWVVGQNRAFKDIDAWRKHYVEAYFNS